MDSVFGIKLRLIRQKIGFNPADILDYAGINYRWLKTMDLKKHRASAQNSFLGDRYRLARTFFLNSLLMHFKLHTRDSVKNRLCATSVVKEISYSRKEIAYHTFTDSTEEVLRLTAKPVRILTVDNELVNSAEKKNNNWLWISLETDCIPGINLDNSEKITIQSSSVYMVKLSIEY
jgi:hypothetical protein